MTDKTSPNKPSPKGEATTRERPAKPAAGRKTSSKVARPDPPRAASDAGRSRLGDLTRPIALDRRLTRRRRTTVALAVVTLAVLGAFAASLFVLPIQTFRAQGQTLEIRERQLAQLVEVNEQLETEVQRLRTNAGIREAARAELGFFEAGEETVTVLPSTQLPTDLPAGWPYGLYRSVIALRVEGIAP
jgi:cell division protein FtsB